MKREPRASTILAERGAARIISKQRRQAGLHRAEAEHVLHELLPDEHRPHQRAKDDDAGHRGHPERGPAGHLQVIQRILSAALPDDKQHPGNRRDDEQAHSRIAGNRPRAGS